MTLHLQCTARISNMKPSTFLISLAIDSYKMINIFSSLV